jgi:hypothetical protein
VAAFGLTLLIGGTAAAQTPPRPPVPVPRPFPGVNPPARPAAEAKDQTTGDLMVGNAPIYPAAEFLEEFDAGNGQRYYLYGTNLAYQDIVDYYKARLRNGGREIFKEPAMQQFELGRFDEDTMSYPPSVVVKDYAWNGSEGYLFVDGITSKRYRTIIQIVPGS